MEKQDNVKHIYMMAVGPHLKQVRDIAERICHKEARRKGFKDYFEWMSLSWDLKKTDPLYTEFVELTFEAVRLAEAKVPDHPNDMWWTMCKRIRNGEKINLEYS